MNEHTQPTPDVTIVPDDKGYHRVEELSDLGLVVRTSRWPYVDVEGQGRMPVSLPTVRVDALGDADAPMLYHRFIRGNDSDAALDMRHQEVIDRLHVGTIRHDGTHLRIQDVAVEVYRFMEERLAYYEQHDEIPDDSLDDPETWAYNTLCETLSADAYDAYDLWDEEEERAGNLQPRHVSAQLAAVGVNWIMSLGLPPTTDYIVRDMAYAIVARWEERHTAMTEGRLPSALAPHEQERFMFQLLAEELETRGPDVIVDDVLPAVDAKLDALTALRKRAGQ